MKPPWHSASQSCGASGSVTIANYADANGWENSKKYPTVTMDANVTVTAKGKDNTGKYYTKELEEAWEKAGMRTWLRYGKDFAIIRLRV